MQLSSTNKNILVSIAAIFVGGLCVGLGHTIQFQLIPLPEGMDFNSEESVLAHVHEITAGGWALTLLAHALGPLVSGFLAAKFAATQHRRVVHIIGIVWTIVGIMNLFNMPHPTWFMIADVCMYLPMAILGGRLARNPL